MAHRPDRVCIPLETEMQPLYRDPPGTARLNRELKRERRRMLLEQRESPTKVQRVLARLAIGARAATGRRRA